MLCRDNYSILIKPKNFRQIVTGPTTFQKESTLPEAQLTLKPDAARAPRFLGNESGLTQYFREISKTRNLSMAEEAELTRQIRNGDRQAMNKLVTANLKFVVSVSRNYQNQGLSLGDLINEGNLGLIRAAKRFDETKNFKFISYAVWWVRQAILQSLAEHSRVIKVPLHRVSAIQRMGKSGTRLEQTLGRAVTLSELSQHMSLTDEDVQECVYLNSYPISLNATPKGNEVGNIGDKLQDENAEKPDEGVLRGTMRGEIKGVLETLGPREASILRLYFGIGGETSHTLEEIGTRLNLTRERVRQIKEKGLTRLKHASRAKRLAVFRA
ncbi:MAG: polymerase subunit sigma [Fibrobacteres bacterium]|nr:polymerase subunit sigma [Fibrobacterota bacterium]